MGSFAQPGCVYYMFITCVKNMCVHASVNRQSRNMFHLSAMVIAPSNASDSVGVFGLNFLKIYLLF